MSLSATSARTRVLTFEVYTSLWWGAFRAWNAFWSALRRNTQVASEAWANRSISYFTALTVGSAGWRDARLFNYIWRHWWYWKSICHQFKINLSVLNFSLSSQFHLTYNWNRAARSIRITRIRLFTAAEGYVIGHPTVRINSTRPRAWIDALIAQTVLITRTICVQ